jgi:hypothetical protein
MNLPLRPLAFVVAVMVAPGFVRAANRPVAENPAENLPPSIKRATLFGERAEWSLDGKRILFLSKIYGDVFELDDATGGIRLLTGFFPHHGFTRALYVSNGDILLSGPEKSDPLHRGDSRTQCFLSVLDHNLAHPPTPLGTKCSEGPAVSRAMAFQLA